MAERQGLETPRLLLLPSPPDLFELLARDRNEAEAAVGAGLPAGWPEPRAARALDPLARIPGGWGLWLVVVRDEAVVVGTSGFKGPPNARRAVEIGYGIDAAHRNRGYAAEAVDALVHWALGRSGVSCVVAECDRANAPSIRVLEKSGFRRCGERGTMLDWELRA